MAEVRAVESVLTGGRLLWIVEAPEPPLSVGDEVTIDGRDYRVTGVEFQPTNPPRYVINGHQGISVEPIPG
jgi:hypothetical protein